MGKAFISQNLSWDLFLICRNYCSLLSVHWFKLMVQHVLSLQQAWAHLLQKFKKIKHVTNANACCASVDLIVCACADGICIRKPPQTPNSWNKCCRAMALLMTLFFFLEIPTFFRDVMLTQEHDMKFGQGYSLNKTHQHSLVCCYCFISLLFSQQVIYGVFLSIKFPHLNQRKFSIWLHSVHSVPC